MDEHTECVSERWAVEHEFKSKVHSIFVPFQCLDLEILLHSAAYFAVTKMCYFTLVSELHRESEVYIQLIY